MDVIMTTTLGLLIVVFLGGIMLFAILSGIPPMLDAIIAIMDRWHTFVRRIREEDEL